ncbi:TPA: Card1-like endonuclease domain-containing protein [Aeromonas veronii]
MQTLHINLVSDQLLPNLIPAFADKSCSGIVLVLGDSTLRHKADTLTQLYQGRGLPIVNISEGSSSHRPVLLQQQARELIDWLATHHGDKRWMLNATCGTKPMALVFANAFNRFNKDHPTTENNGIPQALICYTDSQNHELPLLNDGVDFAMQWQSVMTLDEMLAANGFEHGKCINKDNDQAVLARADLTRHLGRQFQRDCSHFLGALQYAAHYAEKTDLCAELKDKPNHDAQKLCQALQEKGLLQWSPEQSRLLQFSNNNSCKYLSGGWLEELTYLNALDCGFDEVAMSVEGEWQSQAFKQNNERGKNNEFDVLICHNNQLLTIECKAKSWSNQQQGDSTNQDVVLKLESLGRKLGGLFSERLLISARPLPDEMVQRAKDNHIALCDRADGRTIRAELQRYFDKMN